jgi:hypothetical protein
MYRQKTTRSHAPPPGACGRRAALHEQVFEDSLIGEAAADLTLDYTGGVSPTYGTTPVTESTAPIIYQIPADGGVTFPQASTFDLAGLLALLGAGQQVQANQEGVRKKEAAMSSMALDAVTLTSTLIPGSGPRLKNRSSSATAHEKQRYRWPLTSRCS